MKKMGALSGMALALSLASQVPERIRNGLPSWVKFYSYKPNMNLWGHQEDVVRRNKLKLSGSQQRELAGLHGKGKKIYLKIVHQNRAAFE